VIRSIAIDPAGGSPGDLAPAAAWIGRGHIVAYPTDTLYGLAVDPRSPAALAELFAVKGRPAASAIPVLAESLAQVEQWFGTLTGATAALARAFWPGPISHILEAPADIAPAVHAGTGTVAVRVPAHGVARALAGACGYPVTATSANVSGQPPAARADDLGALAADPRVLVIDAGATPGGPASTIVDARGSSPVLVRAGAIAWERVLRSAYA
jgi:L-threonylcarbamoyladenylate synthase